MSMMNTTGIICIKMVTLAYISREPDKSVTDVAFFISRTSEL